MRSARGATVYSGTTRGGLCYAHSTQAVSWSECTDSEWFLGMLNKGYRLHFAMRPPQFRGFIQSRALGGEARVLQEEITWLLERGAIRHIPLDLKGGFI